MMADKINIPLDKCFDTYSEADWKDLFEQHWEMVRDMMLVEHIPCFETYIGFFDVEVDGTKRPQIDTIMIEDLRESMPVRLPRNVEVAMIAASLQRNEARGYVTMSEVWALKSPDKRAVDTYQYGTYGSNPQRREGLSLSLVTKMPGPRFCRMGWITRVSGGTQGATHDEDWVAKLEIDEEIEKGDKVQLGGNLVSLLEMEVPQLDPLTGKFKPRAPRH